MAPRSRRDTLRWLGVSAVGLTAGCSGSESPATDDGSTATDTDRGSDGTPSDSPTDEAPTEDQSAGVDPLWTYDVEVSEQGLPRLAVADGTVYVPGQNLHALSLDGDRAWIYETERPVYGTPIVRDAVYLTTADQRDSFGAQWARVLHAVEPDGSRRWRFSIDIERRLGSFELLAVGNGHAYVATRTDYSTNGGMTLYAVDTDTGDVDWRTDVGNPSEASVIDGAVVVNSYEGLRVVEADGTERWSLSVDSSGTFRPTVDDDRVYVDIGFDELRAFDRESGDRAWRYRDSYARTSLRAGDAVFVERDPEDTDTAAIAALDPATGRERWTTDVDGRTGEPKLLVDERLVAMVSGRSAGKPILVAFDPDSGEERWRHEVADDHGSLAVSGDTIYTGHDGLSALAATDGSRRWRHGADVASTDLAVGGDRVVTLASTGAVHGFAASPPGST